MIILAILQNQWFREPDRVQEIYDRYPDKRHYFIRQFLFMGCATGKRLRSALGAELCSHIIWEEAHPKIGGHSGSSFGADLEHIKKAVDSINPELIICFGRIAGDAVKALNLPHQIIYAPHPASRQNPMPRLKALPEEIKNFQGKIKSVRQVRKPSA